MEIILQALDCVACSFTYLIHSSILYTVENEIHFNFYDKSVRFAIALLNWNALHIQLIRQH